MRNSEPLKEFIRQNYQTSTITQMAKNFGISKTSIHINCRKLGIKPITEKELSILFIKNHPELTPEQLAPHLKMEVNSVKNLISREKLRPLIYKPQPKSKHLSKPSQDEHKDFEITEEEKITIQQWKEKQKQLRENRANYTKYNQTHSPFGFADELRGIHSTKDPQPFYMSIVRL